MLNSIEYLLIGAKNGNKESTITGKEGTAVHLNTFCQKKNFICASQSFINLFNESRWYVKLIPVFFDLHGIVIVCVATLLNLTKLCIYLSQASAEVYGPENFTTFCSTKCVLTIRTADITIHR